MSFKILNGVALNTYTFKFVISNLQHKMDLPQSWDCMCIKYVPIISATVRPLLNLPLGNPLPKSIPYHGKLAWAKLLLRYLLFPTSERESPNMNCTVLQLQPSMAIPRTVTNIVSTTKKFMFDKLQLFSQCRAPSYVLGRWGFRIRFKKIWVGILNIWRSVKS